MAAQLRVDKALDDHTPAHVHPEDSDSEELLGVAEGRYPVPVSSTSNRLVVRSLRSRLPSSSTSLSLSHSYGVTAPNRLVLGPVVGKVTATSAVVLVEVAAAAVVTCVFTDAVTQHSVRLRKRLPAGRPCGYLMQRLLPQTRYEVWWAEGMGRNMMGDEN